MGLETHPWPDPSSFPLDVAWKPARHAGIHTPSPGDLQGMLGYYLQGMLGYHHPPVNRITDTCKNISSPQLRLRAVMITVILKHWHYFQNSTPITYKMVLKCDLLVSQSNALVAIHSNFCDILNHFLQGGRL